MDNIVFMAGEMLEDGGLVLYLATLEIISSRTWVPGGEQLSRNDRTGCRCDRDLVTAHRHFSSHREQDLLRSTGNII